MKTPDELLQMAPAYSASLDEWKTFIETIQNDAYNSAVRKAGAIAKYWCETSLADTLNVDKALGQDFACDCISDEINDLIKEENNKA